MKQILRKMSAGAADKAEGFINLMWYLFVFEPATRWQKDAKILVVTVLGLLLNFAVFGLVYALLIETKGENPSFDLAVGGIYIVSVVGTSYLSYRFAQWLARIRYGIPNGFED